jgi:hypothetical protein
MKEAKCKTCGVIYVLDPTCEKMPSACVCTCEGSKFIVSEY